MTEDAEIYKLARKEKKIRKRKIFKEYVSTYCNLGLELKGNNKKAKLELEAIAVRGVRLIIKNIVRKADFPISLPKHRQPFITIVVHAGMLDTLDEKKTFIYPAVGGTLEEV